MTASTPFQEEAGLASTTGARGHLPRQLTSNYTESFLLTPVIPYNSFSGI